MPKIFKNFSTMSLDELSQINEGLKLDSRFLSFKTALTVIGSAVTIGGAVAGLCQWFTHTKIQNSKLEVIGEVRQCFHSVDKRQDQLDQRQKDMEQRQKDMEQRQKDIEVDLRKILVAVCGPQAKK